MRGPRVPREAKATAHKLTAYNKDNKMLLRRKKARSLPLLPCVPASVYTPLLYIDYGPFCLAPLLMFP